MTDRSRQIPHRATHRRNQGGCSSLSVHLALIYVLLLGGIMGLGALRTMNSAQKVDDSVATENAVPVEARLVESSHTLIHRLEPNHIETMLQVGEVFPFPTLHLSSFAPGVPVVRLRLLRVIQI